MSLLIVILLVVGLTLVYSAIKNKNPQDLVKDALKRK